MAEREDLSYEHMWAKLHYDPETGVFTWLKGKFAGQRAGGIKSGRKGGYRQIYLSGYIHRCARLAVFYMTHRWPVEHVDHINGVRDDDSWGNLREATRYENARNIKKMSRNTSGYIGVTYYPTCKNPWRAKLKVAGKFIHIGMFPDAVTAKDAYDAATLKYFGEFRPRQV